ncbi:hypothetical protein B0H94_10313 [Salsuginibacillus halophilus]|uniref:Uncharacterized protein n=1 Tax=Salsuginibacillus halophilus TaxID=517424 RepID=A0A2P8HVZ1_9BACI|nr:hypothetical protein [Salsuginibacillus halophilus]PSL50402.1 hypothetical protein B0H94_10313 [Salsuginibacillus halophilus]
MEEVITALLALFLVLFVFAAWRIAKQLRELHYTQSQLLVEAKKLVQNSEFLSEAETERHQDNLRRFVISRALEAREAVEKQTAELRPRAVENVHINNGLTREELLEAFTPEEAQAVQQFFNATKHYIETYWKTDRGHLKTVFTGHPDAPNGEVQSIKKASRSLLKTLDDHFSRMHQTS